MPQSEQTDYLMQCVPKDDDWWFFTQLMYDKINSLPDKPEEVIIKMKAHEAQLLKAVDFELTASAKCTMV
jgi:hypothetical protein